MSLTPINTRWSDGRPPSPVHVIFPTASADGTPPLYACSAFSCPRKVVLSKFNYFLSIILFPLKNYCTQLAIITPLSRVYFVPAFAFCRSLLVQGHVGEPDGTVPSGPWHVCSVHTVCYLLRQVCKQPWGFGSLIVTRCITWGNYVPCYQGVLKVVL